MGDKIFVLGYLSDKEDDGAELYTSIKLFKSEDDLSNYLWDNEGMTKKQIKNFIDKDTIVETKLGSRLVHWVQCIE